MHSRVIMRNCDLSIYLCVLRSAHWPSVGPLTPIELLACGLWPHFGISAVAVWQWRRLWWYCAHLAGAHFQVVGVCIESRLNEVRVQKILMDWINSGFTFRECEQLIGQFGNWISCYGTDLLIFSLKLVIKSHIFIKQLFEWFKTVVIHN